MSVNDHLGLLLHLEQILQYLFVVFLLVTADVPRYLLDLLLDVSVQLFYFHLGLYFQELGVQPCVFLFARSRAASELVNVNLGRRAHF